MSFIECECGSKFELSTTATRVTCPSCGQRFTVPQIENDDSDAKNAYGADASAEVVAIDSEPVAVGSSACYKIAGNRNPTNVPPHAGLSSTMLHDLPVVTQFDQHYAQSILAVGMFTSQASSCVAENTGGPQPYNDVFAAAAGAAPLLAALPADTPLATPLGQRGTRKSQRPERNQASTNAEVQLTPGQFLLERYEVQRKIGQGGMSSVYEACDHVRGEQVALKILLPHLAAKPKLQERFLQEGRLSSNFSHPNIARVYDLHQTASHILLSMELLHGSTLRHDMHRRKTQGQSYRPAEVVTILHQVAEALSVVHAADIVHRDLKPENLWLGLDGTVKVMDFGIARDSVKGAHTTGPRGSGTPYYIAPEQLTASPTLDHRADQYSLAIIAYELLTGEIPQGAVVPPHIRHPHIPKKLSLTIFRGLSAAPEQRFNNIREFQAALQYDRRMPVLAKLAIAGLAVAALGGTGYAFQRWGLPMFETKVSPVWSDLSAQKITEGNAISFAVRHPDCTLTGDSLRYKLLSDAPAGAEINGQTGEFKWTPSEAQGPKNYSFNVMAIVEQQGRAPVVEERTLEITVNEAYNAPVFETPEAVSLKENSPAEISLVAHDPNEPPLGLIYELIDPPSGMTIDERTGVVRWTPREDAGGTHPVIPVRVSLAGDEHREITTTRKLSLHVEEAIDKLVFTSTERFEAEVGQAMAYRVTARDPNTPTLNTFYRLKGADRLGMTIEPRTGQIEWTPSEDAAGKTFDIAVEACWDGAGKTEVVGSQALKVKVAEMKPKAEEPSKTESDLQATLASASTTSQPEVDKPLPPPNSTCPTGGGANSGVNGNGAGAGMGGGQCNTQPGNNGASQTGNCPNAGGNNGGRGQPNNVPGLIVDIVSAAVAKHKQPAVNGQAGNNPVATAPTRPPVLGGLPINQNQLPIDKLPINKLPINKLPINKSPTHQLPVNPLPINRLPSSQSAVKKAANTSPSKTWPSHSNMGNSGGQNRRSVQGGSLKQKIEQEFFKAQQNSNSSLRSLR